MKKEANKLKQFWNWLWNSESIWSYLVFLVLVYIFIKLIFFPILSLLMGTSLPLAIVESSSMDHRSLNDYGNYEICGNTFPDKESFNSEEYWNICGKWYENNTNITKEQFSKFRFENGFSKGDLMIIIGKDNPEIGDVIVFQTARAHPIIHRIISKSPTLETKGDHNPAQLPEETNISENQVIGVAVAKIPYIGWLKLFFVEAWKFIRS